jgi:hypothetical protein
MPMNRPSARISSLFSASLLILGLSVLAAAAAVSFGPPKQYAVQKGPSGAAIADFDGDKIVDLVVPNLITGSISVLRGNGDGTFAPAQNYPIIDSGANSDGPFAVVAADFNGDHKMDVALVNSDRKAVVILMGNGNGTFGRGAVIQFPDIPYAIVAGDFNGDGKTDLAIGSGISSDNKTPGKVTILLGNGNGTFAAQAPITLVGASPLSMAAADFDEDKKLDLVVTSMDDNHPNLVQVLFGKGDGTFRQPPTVLSASGSAWAVAVGRFDKSKHPGFATLGAHSGVSLFLGDGRGGFKNTWNTRATVNAIRALAVGDFNHDGVDDVVVGGTPPGTVQVMLADGAGHLSPGAAYPMAPATGPLPNWQLFAADLNSDGYADLVSTSITGNINGESVAVSINQH